MINKSLVAAVGIAALSLSAGCRTNNESVFIRQVPIPDPQNQCIVTADPTTKQLFQGTFDTSLAKSYRQVFMFGNQLVQRGDAARLRPETSRVVMFEADVQVFVDGNVIADFQAPTNGVADPANETTPGYGISEVNPLIPGDAADAIVAAKGPFKVGSGAFVVARVKLKGNTLGGLNVSTGPFDFPIFVCGNAKTHTPCIGAFAPSSCDDQLKSACQFGQDTEHDCREVAKVDAGFVCSDATGKLCK